MKKKNPKEELVTRSILKEELKDFVTKKELRSEFKKFRKEMQKDMIELFERINNSFKEQLKATEFYLGHKIDKLDEKYERLDLRLGRLEVRVDKIESKLLN